MMKKKPLFIGIVGHKKSGKTSLIEVLTKELKRRGHIVGTIKSTVHDLEFDTPGKDTYRHRMAGSAVTLIKSSRKLAIFTSSEYADEDIKRDFFRKCDFVLVEGDTRSNNPKIYVADNNKMRDDITGKVIAVWGDQMKLEGVRNFGPDSIDDLCALLRSFKLSNSQS